MIVLPERFKNPRYLGGAWMDSIRWWSDEDRALLAAACDLKISYGAAANTLGRSPSALVSQAYALGIHMPREWRAAVYTPHPRQRKAPKEKARPFLNLDYPYVIKPDARHDDLIAVSRMVARALPGREDVCQDVMLALWESRTSLADLRTDPRALKAFVKSFRKASFERSGYGVESMDVTIHSDDGRGKSKYEDARYQRTLVDHDDQFIEDTLFGKPYERDFASLVVDDVSAEEVCLGVPAAFWMRTENANEEN